jgi:hypothetical protein
VLHTLTVVEGLELVALALVHTVEAPAARAKGGVLGPVLALPKCNVATLLQADLAPGPLGGGTLTSLAE